VSSRPGAVH